MTDIILKQGTGVPSDTDLEVAEVAIDTSTGDMYTKLSDGSIKNLNPEGADGGTGSGGSIQDGDTEGQITTWNGSDWTPESAVVVKGGNVGIGTDTPEQPMHVHRDSDGTALLLTRSTDGKFRGLSFTSSTAGGFSGAGWTRNIASGAGVHAWAVNGDEKMRIDASGNVGIGMTPAIRTAKEQLAEWKVSFDARLKEEPKADKKAVTLEITDDAFEVLPTEDKLAKWMETRAAGDRLQVDGNGYFSGTVNAAKFHSAFWIRQAYNHGLAIGTTGLFPVDGDGVNDPSGLDIGTSGVKFKDGYFSGTVTAGKTSIWDGGIYRNQGTFQAGLRFFENQVAPSGASNNLTDGEMDIGAAANKFKDGYFSGTVNADKFVGDGSGLTGVGGGKTYGNGNGITVNNTSNTIAMSGSYTGTFTASGDVVAYSDERLKDNVETLDGSKVFEMRGVSFTKDGKESSGVIAQEIQKVAPELVSDDGEYLGVAYGNLVGYLIEAVKELKAEIEELKNG